jgi:hypothetical protein
VKVTIELDDSDAQDVTWALADVGATTPEDQAEVLRAALLEGLRAMQSRAALVDHLRELGAVPETPAAGEA